MRKYLTIAECQDGNLYLISSRNLALGVFRADVAGFIGIRTKFGNRFLFTEFHYDTGAPFGTVFPIKDLGECPFKGDKDELFRWLEKQEILYKKEISEK